MDSAVALRETPGLQPRRPVTHEHQPELALACRPRPGEALDQDARPLFRMQPSDREDQGGLGAGAAGFQQPPAQGLVPEAGRKAAGLDAERHGHRTVHPEGGQPARQPPSGRHGHVESGAEPAHPLPPGFEEAVHRAGLHHPTEQGLGIAGDEVLVEHEGSRRLAWPVASNPAAAPGRGPLDQVRGQCGDGVPYRAGPVEAAIVRVERHGRALDPEDAAGPPRLLAVRLARGDDGQVVAVSLGRLELLFHIAAHPAAAGSIESADIDDPHPVDDQAAAAMAS